MYHQLLSNNIKQNVWQRLRRIRILISGVKGYVIRDQSEIKRKPVMTGSVPVFLNQLETPLLEPVKFLVLNVETSPNGVRRKDMRAPALTQSTVTSSYGYV